jgi:hypothetical protein
MLWAGMPEATVNKDREAIAGEHDVAASSKPWQRAVDPIPVSTSVQNLAQRELTGSVSPARPLHPSARLAGR